MNMAWIKIIQTLIEKFLRKLFAISNCRKCICLENESVDGPGLERQWLAKHEPDRPARSWKPMRLRFSEICHMTLTLARDSVAAI